MLYDKECEDFKDKNRTSQAWAQASREMGMTKGKVNLSILGSLQ